MKKIKQKLSLVPNKPGCYQMKNKDGIIIYVGKAKRLKNRLSSYFRGTHTGKTAKLVSEIDTFEYIVVESEIESLILENNLIKKYDPKYNILLRDDKSYPYIEFLNEDVPKLTIVRNINRKKKKNTNLYGPYPNVTAARNTVNLLNRMYPLRKCNTFESKPCLYYHIHECLGYCTKNVKAKELKDMLDYIKIVLTIQKVVIKEDINTDIFGYFVDKGYLSIQVFFIRGGKIVEKHSKIFPLVDEVDQELNHYISSFYDKGVILPKEIIVPSIVDDILLSNYLGVKIIKPIKGVKNKLVEMANNNAEILLKEKFELIKKDEEKTIGANEELRNLLKLDKLDRIELFDNAHLFGTFNVSGMVVYVSGKPSKNDYRKFKISVDKNDDYGTMSEVIYRRYFRVLKDNLVKPDLIIVDGGIGQINVARGVINSLGLDIMVVGLKKDNHHTTEALLAFDPIEELKIDKKSNLFYYLERMQDEVHNFTISYHKQIRSKGSLSSILDNIEGIGEKRKRELLKKYHNLTLMKEASIEELSKIVPENVASNLHEFLNNI